MAAWMDPEMCGLLPFVLQDGVASWQRKLGTVDSVLTTWQDVQRKWQVCVVVRRDLRVR